MLNKRVKTFLTLMLAGAMVLSEPAALWASGEKTSQSESEKSDSEDSEEDSVKKEKEEGTKEEKSKIKKKKVSSNSASSNGASSNQVSFDNSLKKAETSGPVSEDEVDEDEDADKAEKNDEPVMEDGGLEEKDESARTDAASSEEEKSEESDVREERARVYRNPFEITGGVWNTHFRFDDNTGVLTVISNNALTISGNAANGGSVSVNSPGGANLLLKDLHITTSNNAALNVMADTGDVRIGLSGNNVLNGAGNSIQVNNKGSVTIYGNGILSGNEISGSVKIEGGNILASIREARDVSGNALTPKRLENLSANRLYSVSGNTGTAYGDGVYSDQNGTIVLYLPQGYTAARRGTTDILDVSLAPSGTVTPTLTPTLTPTSTPSPDIAYEADNTLNWIDSGTTYRSGATLQFYATGAGYGPEEPQELNPVNGSTRYIPVNWNVSTISTSVSGNNGRASGSWTEYSEETTGRTVSDTYVPGEYRFKGSFLLNTTGTASVPFTLQVNYQKQTYNGAWRDDGGTVSKSVSFYIRNTTATVTSTVRPTTTTYVRSTVTTSAVRSNVSSNARNATTGDETPIGTLVLMLVAAAVSGVAVFRKKRTL